MTTSGSDDFATFRRVLRRATPALTRSLPWIDHGDPWAILVSEFMLQQTQSSRVIEPWRRFVEAFPTPRACARAPLSSVLRHWDRLGYPRRAKALHDSAKIITDQFAGHVPGDVGALRTLPGVGEYTANAVASFAFGAHVAVLDTNVGRVLARAIANRTLKASEARGIAAALLPRRHEAEFNQAMLDLGAQYCRATPRCAACPVATRCRWRREGGSDPAPTSAGVSRRQPTFVGSDRQVRGLIVAALRLNVATDLELASRYPEIGVDRLETNLASLERDGLIERHAGAVRLAGDEH